MTLFERSSNYLKFFALKGWKRGAVIESQFRWFLYNLGRGLQTDKKQKKDLLVTLTTTPKRFAVVEKTLRSIVSQSYRPATVRIFIEKQFEESLTRQISHLSKFGIQVIGVEAGLGPHNKLVPQLRMGFEEAYLIYLDDDIIYPRHLFQTMIETSQRVNDSSVIANWGQLCTFDKNGDLVSYRKWPSWREAGTAPQACVPLGVAGVLLPQGLVKRKFQELGDLSSLCPYQDDLINFATIVKNDLKVVMNFKKQRIPITWPHSQDENLWKSNVNQGENDKCVKKLLTIFPEIRRKLVR